MDESASQNSCICCVDRAGRIRASCYPARCGFARRAKCGEIGRANTRLSSQVPAGALPQTLDPASFENPVVQNAYTLAAKVKRVLYQQPCYCHCDRSIGHGSLLDCFAGKHASVCDVCIREGIYSYEQTQKKKRLRRFEPGSSAGNGSKWIYPNTKQHRPNRNFGISPACKIFFPCADSPLSVNF